MHKFIFLEVKYEYKKEVSVSKVAEIVIRELNLINIDVVEHA